MKYESSYTLSFFYRGSAATILAGCTSQTTPRNLNKKQNGTYGHHLNHSAPIPEVYQTTVN